MPKVRPAGNDSAGLPLAARSRFVDRLEREERAGGADFVVELLTELRAGRYAPAAWARFLGRSWQRSVDDARSEPKLVRSCLLQSALLAGLAALALRWHWRRVPPCGRARQAGEVALLLLLQQAYVALHLGMTQADATSPRFDRLGVAYFLTMLRGLCAMLLITADADDRPLFALLLAIGGAADALDGPIARRSGAGSRMGRMLDPMADVAFYSAATWAAVRRRTLPAWFGGLALERFLLPVGAGLYRYFWQVRTLEAEHTIWGMRAGVLLTVLATLGAVRPRLARALCLPTAAALILASALQLRRALQLDDEAPA